LTKRGQAFLGPTLSTSRRRLAHDKAPALDQERRRALRGNGRGAKAAGGDDLSGTPELGIAPELFSTSLNHHYSIAGAECGSGST